MPQIDIVDATWIGVPARRVGPVVADPANWSRWWPRLRLEVVQSRGARGMRWRVPWGEQGRVTGSMEVWLEAVGAGPGAGVVAHFFLRLDATAGRLPARRARRLANRYRVEAKRLFWSIGDQLDPARLARVRSPARPPAGAERWTGEPVAFQQ